MNNKLTHHIGMLLVLAAVAVWGQMKTEDLALPIDQYVYAQGLMQNKLYDYAEVSFRKFIERNPGHKLIPEAESNIIKCYRSLEKHDEMIQAIHAFKERRKDHPNVDVFTFWEGLSYYSRERYVEAVKCFESLQQSKNEEIQEKSIFMQANSLLRCEGKTEQAIRLYEQLGNKALTADKRWREQSLGVLADYYFNKLDYDHALPAYTKLEAFEAALPEIRETALSRIGEIQYGRRNFGEARKIYDRYLLLFPNAKWADDVRKRRAEAVYQLGDISEALKQVLEWRKRHPETVDYEMDCLNGRCLYDTREYLVAGPYFDAVVQNAEAPMEIRRFSLVHAISCRLEDTKPAAWEHGLEDCALYFKTYHDADNECMVMEYQGRLQEKLGQYAAAIASYEATIKQLPAQDAAHGDTLKLRLVRCFRETKQWQKAAALMRQVALSGYSQDQQVQLLLAAADLEQKVDANSIEAAKDFEAVLTCKGVKPSDMMIAREKLLSIYYAKKDFKRAQEQVAVLLPLKQGAEAELLEHLDAQLLYKLGRRDESQAVLEKALKRPSFAEPKREIEMRMLLWQLLQLRLKDGDTASGDVLIDNYVQLFAKQTDKDASLAPAGAHYQVARLVSDRLQKGNNIGDRKLLMEIYERIISMGYGNVHSIFSAYRLAILYMEPGDGRFHQAEVLLRGMSKALEQLLAANSEAAAEMLKMFAVRDDTTGKSGSRQAYELVTEASSLLAECCFHQGKDADALTEINRVQERSKGVLNASYRRCLLIKARICYERKPQDLKEAFEALHACLNVRHSSGKDSEDADALVLYIKVLMAMDRMEPARTVFKQLQFRYPERARLEEEFKKLAE